MTFLFTLLLTTSPAQARQPGWLRHLCQTLVGGTVKTELPENVKPRVRETLDASVTRASRSTRLRLNLFEADVPDLSGTPSTYVITPEFISPSVKLTPPHLYLAVDPHRAGISWGEEAHELSREPILLLIGDSRLAAGGRPLRDLLEEEVAAIRESRRKYDVHLHSRELKGGRTQYWVTGALTNAQVKHVMLLLLEYASENLMGLPEIKSSERTPRPTV